MPDSTCSLPPPVPADSAPALPPETVANRYARQAILPQIGSAGQARLGSASVLVIGCGALGSVQAELLVRAGVGRVIVVDRDIPAYSNLHRQFLYTEADVAARIPKAEAAAAHLRAINSGVTVDARVMDVTPANIEALVQEADIILDGTDNIETRYVINDACVMAGKPWVYGGVIGTEGLCVLVEPGVGPCLRCLFPEPPPPGSLPTCAVAGVLNTAVTITSSLQVNAVLKRLIEGASATTSMWSFDLWQNQFHHSRMKRQPDCPCCGKQQFDFLEARQTAWVTSLCGRNAIQVTPAESATVELAALAQRLNAEGRGRAVVNGKVLQYALDAFELLIFPDGRVIVNGTTDPAIARSLITQYLWG